MGRRPTEMTPVTVLTPRPGLAKGSEWLNDTINRGARHFQLPSGHGDGLD
jgi:hypothetical protein